MFEAFILGAVQGIAEWLPVSSEGLIVLVKSNFFPDGSGLFESIQLALFLHLGTFFAAVVYFRKDVFSIIKTIFRYKSSSENEKSLVRFLFLATIISGALGVVILYFIGSFESYFEFTGKSITFVISIMLFITAFLQIKSPTSGDKVLEGKIRKHGIILGIVQGFSALPGLSRSGSTVSAFLFSGFKDTEALRLSFLMSMPIILGGNLALGITSFSLSLELLVALLFSFLFGLATINILLSIARKIKFGYFVLFFAFLTLASVLFV